MRNNVDWFGEAKRIFQAPRPEHFTDYLHCPECAEHDETLRKADNDSIGPAELGNPGWDPICFCHDEGKKYFMPAFIRLSLETIGNEFYLGSLLLRLEGDGANNNLIRSCSLEQRRFITSFLEHVMAEYGIEIETNGYTMEAGRVREIWNGRGG